MKSKRMKDDKRGLMGIVFFVLILFTILIVGFIAVILVAVADFASDEITPVMEDLGMVGSANFSQAAEYTFGTVDVLIGALPWLLTFSYIAMIVFSIIFVVAYQYNPHPAYMGIYFLFVVLLIFGAIIMSNMYQDLYQTDDDVIGAGLKVNLQCLFNLHSPAIFAVIALMVGIYMFAGIRSHQGGFEV